METTGGEASGSGLSPTELKLRETGIGLGIGVLGFVGGQGGGLVFAIVALPFFGFELAPELNLISTVGFGVGVAGAVALYFAVSRHDLSFVDVSMPDARDVGYAVGGLLLLFGALVVVSIVMNQLEVESSTHSIEETARQGDPAFLLYMIPLSILVIGPAEELVYRNLVQKRLADTFTEWGAILVASVIFAVVHFQAYLTGALDEVLTSLGVVFALSIVLGWIYARTRNLFVPAVVHGLFNAIQFGMMYYTITGEVPFV